MQPSPLTIWCLTDNKPGHKNQLIGLTQSLSSLTPAKVVWLPIPEFDVHWRELLAKDQSPAFNAQLKKLVESDSTSPDLVIGAGHTTHKAILAIKKHKKSFAVVLMRPSLPYRLFDAVIVPRHDTPPSRQNILPTDGVLNTIKFSSSIQKDNRTGLILIGGESKHFQWDNQKVIQQIAVLLSTTKIQWLLTDSRRTPESFLDELQQYLDKKKLNPKITVICHQSTPPHWLPEQLQSAGQTWVTPDSVSMVYESLTANCPTGIFELTQRKNGKIVKSLKKLVHEDKITHWKEWQSTGTLKQPIGPFCEAERAAKWLLDKFTSTRKIRSNTHTSHENTTGTPRPE